MHASRRLFSRRRACVAQPLRLLLTQGSMHREWTPADRGGSVTVALALVDTVLAMDELKLEKRKLRSTLDPVESATYDLLVRIGERHAQMMKQTTALPVAKRRQQASAEQVC